MHQIKFYCPHCRHIESLWGEAAQHRWRAQSEPGMNSVPPAARDPKPLLPPTACVPELRTLTAHDVSSGFNLQTLVTVRVSFSSSSYNPTVPDSEAARLPLPPNQGKSVTLASAWTPVEQKPSLGQPKGL